MRYIEVFYNRRRPHTNNEGLPPATAMANFTTASRCSLTENKLPDCLTSLTPLSACRHWPVGADPRGSSYYAKPRRVSDGRSPNLAV
jgi:hypothetical protein